MVHSLPLSSKRAWVCRGGGCIRSGAFWRRSRTGSCESIGAFDRLADQYSWLAKAEKMNSSRAEVHLTRLQKVLIYAVFLSLLAGVFLLSAEYVVRKKRVWPWAPPNEVGSVEPGGRVIATHPTLGYTHIPGRFTVTLKDGYSFVMTHLQNSLRVTQPLDNYSGTSEKPEIWIFGCSLTHGWTLNDEETYPWLLQQRLPDYQIVNFGVLGYGTLQSLLQYRDALGLKRPRLAILAYAGFHDQRNTLARTWRKALIRNNKKESLKVPYALLAEDGSVQYLNTDREYGEFFMMRRLALSHFLEMQWNAIEEKLLRSHQVSEALILEMARLSKEHRVKFVVAAISEDQQMLKFVDQHGIPNVDISVDLKTKEYKNLPHDSHPSAPANKLYAEKLEPAVKAALSIETGSGAAPIR